MFQVLYETCRNIYDEIKFDYCVWELIIVNDIFLPGDAAK